MICNKSIGVSDDIYLIRASQAGRVTNMNQAAVANGIMVWSGIMIEKNVGKIMDMAVMVSARHAHLCRSDFSRLFGEGKSLSAERGLKHLGEFVANERVDIAGPKGLIRGVRIVGPLREYSQVEISLTDARALGINAPVRDSEDVIGSPGARLIGPAGTSEISCGVIVSRRHIHLSHEDAHAHRVSDFAVVDARVKGARPVVFREILVRICEAERSELHIDTDEANAAGIAGGAHAEIIV
jgi:putative phosphotransacetylase